MTICVNGSPKSGTHALLKACELLGVNPYMVNHIPFGNTLPEGTDKHIVIFRDPRNVVISWLRFQRKDITEGTIIAAATNTVKLQSQFVGWMNDPSTLILKFEDLIKNDAEIRKLANYLGVNYLDSAFPNLCGFTRTWTGSGRTPNYSDYTKYWTPAVEAFWASEEPAALLNTLGYK